MNKQDTLIVVLLVAMLLAWFKFQSPSGSQTPPDAVPGAVQDSTNLPPVEVAEPVNVPTASPGTVEAASPVDAVSVPELRPAVINHSGEEKFAKLRNEDVELTVSTWGGCIKSVRLLQYPVDLGNDSEPVTFDFEDAPPLSISGVDGFGTGSDFEVIEEGSQKVVLQGQHGELTLRRTLELGEGYDLSVSDVFLTDAEAGATVPKQVVEVGSMTKVESKASVRGMTYICIDSLPAAAGSKVVHWSKTKSLAVDGVNAKNVRFEDRFKPAGQRGGCAMFKPKLEVMLPASVELSLQEATQWVAVKNKFFVSMLAPAEGASGAFLSITREVPSTELAANSATWVQVPTIEKVSARLAFGEVSVSKNAPYTREYTYYVGPKKYAELKKISKEHGEIMQFGFWSPLSRILLTTLNAIHSVFGNYGVAIILLTVIVRLIFWPVTHKSTESMKRMQTIQPEVKKLQEKYKDNPTKLNQATMALYKEHKVNPMAGCLPLVIQIPVFFALFTVLRSAVELRFAGFLWIADLSEQEGLLPGVLPFVSCLNILPIVMTGLTLFQQKMTPSAGDPQQQKMMMFMPVMFLFLFYPMPSALVLYWTTSQLIALIQLLLQQRKKKPAVAATA